MLHQFNPTNKCSINEAVSEDTQMGSLITCVKVTEAVKQLPMVLSKGLTRFIPKFLKALGVLGQSWLTRLCNIV